MDLEFLKQNNVNVEKSLELFGDVKTYNETLNDYLEGIDEKKFHLNNAFTNKNWSDYAIFAHSIKSDARYLGFESTQEICYKHEIAGKEENQKFIENDYQNMLNEVDKMTLIIKKYFNNEEIKVPQVENKENDNNLILVADDSKLICNFITKSLEDRYNIKCVSNGKEVIDILNNPKYKISMLLLDIFMPELDGIKVLEYIRTSTKFKKLPISIISGDTSEETIKKVFEFDVVDMLNKPFSKDDLINVSEKTLRFSEN